MQRYIGIFHKASNYLKARGEPRLELSVHAFGIMWKYFWNSLDNAPFSIVFYLKMKVEVEVGVQVGRGSPLV